MDPPGFLKPGDVVRCEIDGIGAIENRVAGQAKGTR
jgi:2-keto-4-pentenoate hydratase/2-oxohepta-3-ene-1,7-dioic acid hydratase in catechol pathway